MFNALLKIYFFLQFSFFSKNYWEDFLIAIIKSNFLNVFNFKKIKNFFFFFFFTCIIIIYIKSIPKKN